jgi:hypothetical protein
MAKRKAVVRKEEELEESSCDEDFLEKSWESGKVKEFLASYSFWVTCGCLLNYSMSYCQHFIYLKIFLGCYIFGTGIFSTFETGIVSTY